MNLAAEEVLLRQATYREAANSYQLCHVTLYRFVQKKKKRDAKKSIDSDSSESDDCFCLVCTEPYSNSRSNEK